MRICELSNVELTYNFLAPLFRALRADGHEVVAACRFDRGGTYLQHYLGDGYAFHEIPAARRISIGSVTVDVLRLARYLRRERFDVVHVHGPLVSMQARVAARLARVPTVIYHAHGFYFHEGMAGRTYRAARWLERTFCRHLTDVVVTINEEDLRLARRQRFRPDPGDIIHAPGVGIDTERFSPQHPATDPDVAELRARLAPEPDATVVTFVGRLVGEKGVRELLVAFDAIAAARPHARLVIIGEQHSSERDHTTGAWVRQFVTRSRAGERIMLLGRRHDVPDLLRATDVFVLPSHREGMPVSLLEAMATGLACVTTDVRGCREAVDGGAGVLVPPRDPAALADVLATLADDPQLRAAIGAQARRRVVDRYAVSQSVAPVRGVFRRIDGRTVNDRRRTPTTVRS